MNLDIDENEVFNQIISGEISYEAFYSWVSIQKDKEFERGMYQLTES